MECFFFQHGVSREIFHVCNRLLNCKPRRGLVYGDIVNAVNVSVNDLAALMASNSFRKVIPILPADLVYNYRNRLLSLGVKY
jgi:hypothetical protein